MLSYVVPVGRIPSSHHSTTGGCARLSERWSTSNSESRPALRDCASIRCLSSSSLISLRSWSPCLMYLPGVENCILRDLRWRADGPASSSGAPLAAALVDAYGFDTTAVTGTGALAATFWASSAAAALARTVENLGAIVLYLSRMACFSFFSLPPPPAPLPVSPMRSGCSATELTPPLDEAGLGLAAAALLDASAPAPDRYGLACLFLSASMRALAAAILAAISGSTVGLGGSAAGPGAAKDVDAEGAGGAGDAEPLAEPLFWAFKRASTSAFLAAIWARMAARSSAGFFAGGCPAGGPSAGRRPDMVSVDVMDGGSGCRAWKRHRPRQTIILGGETSATRPITAKSPLTHSQPASRSRQRPAPQSAPAAQALGDGRWMLSTTTQIELIAGARNRPCTRRPPP